MDAPSATEVYQEMRYKGDAFAVHVGFAPSDVRDIPHFAPAAADGDGWNVWGEAPGMYGNDEDTHHVVLLTTEPDITVAVLETIGRSVLVPMSRGDIGTIIVVTDKDDWSDVKHVVKR